MHCVKVLVVVLLLLWSSSAMAITLAWNANTEIDLVGYKVYQCGALPCAPGSGRESLLATLGKVTSYDIGTPSLTKYYFITAYDRVNLESGGSNLVTYTPASQTATAPPIANLALNVVGTPLLGKWGVEAVTTDMRDIMTTVYLDGKVYLTDSNAPYSFPASSGLTTTGTFGAGSHKVEFIFYLQGTATEIGRANVTVQEGMPTSSPSSTVTLTVLGNPSTGPWGVEGKTTDMRDVMADIYLDGKHYTTENAAPYAFPYDNGTLRFGAGSHTVQFIFKLQNTTTEIGRASVTVQEGSQNNVSLALVGVPATGPWGVVGSTTDTRDVMAKIYLDGTLHHTENFAPYGFPSDTTTARFGAGTHTVQYIFYLEGTATEIGRSSITVQEGP